MRQAPSDEAFGILKPFYAFHKLFIRTNGGDMYLTVLEIRSHLYSRNGKERVYPRILYLVSDYNGELPQDLSVYPVIFYAAFSHILLLMTPGTVIRKKSLDHIIRVLLSSPWDLHHLVDLKSIVHLHIRKVVQYDTAFKSELNFLDLVLETLE